MSSSDHELIKFTVEIDRKKVKLPAKRHISRVLDESATTKDIVAALKESEWPFVPFNKIAGIDELLVIPKVHKQSILVAKRALKALETSATPTEFADAVRGIRRDDFENMLENLPDQMRENPRAFYKIVKAVGDVSKAGVLVEEIVKNPGEDSEETVSVEKGLEEMIRDTYCLRKSWGLGQVNG
jgi:hypothetical protein